MKSRSGPGGSCSGPGMGIATQHAPKRRANLRELYQLPGLHGSLPGTTVPTTEMVIMRPNGQVHLNRQWISSGPHYCSEPDEELSNAASQDEELSNHGDLI